MAKRYNLNKIKELKTYSTQEIADLLGVHIRTVQHWYKEGLPRIDERRPYLVFGADLIKFLHKKQTDRKWKCKHNELPCMKCRGPRKPVKNEVFIVVMNEKKARIIGQCPDCGTWMQRYASVEKLSQIAKSFVICTAPDKDLIESIDSIVNTDLQGDLFDEKV